jgi:hypothetical protein
MPVLVRRAAKVIAAAVLSGFALTGCYDKWEVLSVTDMTFPGDCQVAREHFDPASQSDSVPGWTGESDADDVCATVYVKILESDPTEPLPAGLRISVTFAQVPQAGETLRRSASYVIADPAAVSKLRVVGFIAGSAEAVAWAEQNPDGFVLEVAGEDIAPTECVIHLDGNQVDCG